MQRLCSIVGAMMLVGCGLFDPAYGDGEGGYDAGGVAGGEPTDGDAGADAGDIPMTTADNEDPGDTICACAPNNDNIYVMADPRDIYIFNPDTLEFQFVTHIACGEPNGGSKAMGISRKGRAWVEYYSGDIHTVDLTRSNTTTACLDPGFDTYYDPMFAQFGMAFVANSPTDSCEKLYLNTSIPPEFEAPMGRYNGALGVVDPGTLALSRIGSIDFTEGELTGTRDGRMFAFAPGLRSHLSEYDKDSGELLDRWPLPGLGEVDAYSFTFWGGYFYFFTAPEDPDVNSRVTKYDFDDLDGDGMVLTTVIEEAPFRVVAAAVSTCAPSCPRSWRAACSL